jgi:hypothetical protein
MEAGLIHSAGSVYTAYCDPNRDEWATKILPALKKPELSTLEKKMPFARRTLSDWRSGRRKAASEALEKDCVNSAEAELDLTPVKVENDGLPNLLYDMRILWICFRLHKENVIVNG